MSFAPDFEPLRVHWQGEHWDRTLPTSPSIYLDEVRIPEGEPIAGGDLGSAHNPWATLGPRRYAHRSAHLNPQAQAPPLVTPRRDDPPDQPHFFPTLEQDWALWEKHRDLVLASHGLQLTDRGWDKVAALARDLYEARFIIQHPGGNPRGPWTPMSHPSPTLIYGSWCAGCAPTLVALCTTMFIPARMVQMLDHAMTEVWLEGRWNLADNSHNMWTGENEMFSRASLAELLLEPTRADLNLTDAQRFKFWQHTAMMYSPNTGLWHEEKQAADLTPQNALALYPNWADPRFKSAAPHRYMLLGARHHQFTHPALLLRQGRAFGRRFWLGPLDQTRRIIATFTGGPASAAEHVPQHNVPADGGDWFIAINGHPHFLRDLGGFAFMQGDPPEPDFGVWPRPNPAWHQPFDIPLDCLRENAWNTIAIGCEGGGPQFLQFSGHSDMINPETQVVADL